MTKDECDSRDIRNTILWSPFFLVTKVEEGFEVCEGAYPRLVRLLSKKVRPHQLSLGIRNELDRDQSVQPKNDFKERV